MNTECIIATSKLLLSRKNSLKSFLRRWKEPYDLEYKNSISSHDSAKPVAVQR